MLIVRDFAAGRGEPLRRIAELDGDLLERLLRIAFETPQRFAERLAVERIATGGAREVSEVLRFLAEAEIVEAPEHAQLAIDRRVLREQASPWRYRDGEPFTPAHWPPHRRGSDATASPTRPTTGRCSPAPAICERGSNSPRPPAHGGCVLAAQRVRRTLRGRLRGDARRGCRGVPGPARNRDPRLRRRPRRAARGPRDRRGIVRRARPVAWPAGRPAGRPQCKSKPRADCSERGPPAERSLRGRRQAPQMPSLN